MKTTFVTAFMELNEPFQRETYKEDVLQNFKRINDTGLCIHVFLSPGLVDFFYSHISLRTGLVVSILEFQELDTFKAVQDLSLQMPAVRSPNKDSKNYMILMNAKAEFIKKSIKLNPFQTTQYAWMDFGLGHVFKHWDASLQMLQKIASAELIESCIAFPGCWASGRDIENSFVRINWRFCGGFFVGTQEYLLEFADIYTTKFRLILQESNHITWEVNLWHWFEHHLGWKPTWYAADHNDSIVQIPEDCFKKQEQE